MEAPEDWPVLPHGPIQQLEENLWYVRGDLPRGPLGRCMVVVRDPARHLLIHNAMALDPDAMSRLERWGTPSGLIVPGGLHRLDAARYVRRYPELRVYAPAGAVKRVEQITPVHGTPDSFPREKWLSYLHLQGTKKREGVLYVEHNDGATLVFNDALFNLPHGGGIGGLMLRILGSSGGPRVTRLMRWMQVADPSALAAQLDALAATPGLRRILVSHGTPIVDAPAEVLTSVAASL